MPLLYQLIKFDAGASSKLAQLSITSGSTENSWTKAGKKKKELVQTIPFEQKQTFNLSAYKHFYFN